MNHIYHSIWNEALGAWIAVSEIAKGQGKRSANRRKLPASSHSCRVGWAMPTPPAASPLKDWQSSTPLLATGLLLCSSASWALPTGNELVAGQVTVTTPTATQMQINQSSDRAVINWQGFSVGQNEAVNIQQPNAQAALLNRVVGQDASQIQGRLNANGQVYLVNPNGVMFSKTAQVDVGGLIATTHDISSQDFINGKNHFTQNGTTGKVENHGTINTSDGGVVALIGEQVTNTGTINTPKGTTALAAGKTVDLDMKGDGLVEVKVTEAALNAQINNQGAITADGGRVVMTAKAANSLIDTVINQNGIVKAQGLVERNGEIILDGGDNGAVKVTGTLNTDGQKTGGDIKVTGAKVALENNATLTASGNDGGGNIIIGNKQITEQTDIQQNVKISAQTLKTGKAGNIQVLANMEKGKVNVAGQLDASAPNGGDGGFIDTSAAKVTIADSAKINTLAKNGKTGTLLIDPNDYTIAASGGNITGDTLGNNLNSNNVIISTATQGTAGGNGDIFVNQAVTWLANTTLTLNAQRNININANITGSGNSAGVALNPTSDYFLNSGGKITLSGANATFAVNGANYTLIHDVNQLQAIANNLSGKYVLGNDIDASATVNWNSGQGFRPIDGRVVGTNNRFTGYFDGLGHSITNLTINRQYNIIGLFGYVKDSKISNTNLASVNIKGNSNVGGLIGSNENGAITNAHVTGNVSGINSVGGLVGSNYGNISNSGLISGSVTGQNSIGGLVGSHYGNISNSSLVSGSVTGQSNVGGLAGFSDYTSTISNANAIGSVNGISSVGGLVGYNYGGTINNAYATGNVTGTDIYIGGLVGYDNGANISNVYATGNVTGRNSVGGLVGYEKSGTISNAYATGNVSGSKSIGGLVGNNTGSNISNAYATGNVSGTDNIGGLAGFNYWGSINNTYATGGVNGTNNVGGLVGNNSIASINNSFWNTQTTFQNNAVGLAYVSTLNNVQGKTTAQMHQQATFTNWDFNNTWRIVEGVSYPLLNALTQGTLALDAQARNAAKVYDKVAWMGGTAIDYTGFAAGDTASMLQGTLQWGGTSQGAVDVGEYSLIPSGLYSQKYNIVFNAGTLFIAPRIVDVSINKAYDGSPTFTTDFIANPNNIIAGDTVNIRGTASVNSKNADTYTSFTNNNLVTSNTNYTANPVNTANYTYASFGKVNAVINAVAPTSSLPFTNTQPNPTSTTPPVTATPASIAADSEVQRQINTMPLSQLPVQPIIDNNQNIVYPYQINYPKPSENEPNANAPASEDVAIVDEGMSLPKSSMAYTGQGLLNNGNGLSMENGEGNHGINIFFSDLLSANDLGGFIDTEKSKGLPNTAQDIFLASSLFYLKDAMGGAAFNSYLERQAQIEREQSIDANDVFPNSFWDRTLYRTAQALQYDAHLLIAGTDTAQIAYSIADPGTYSVITAKALIAANIIFYNPELSVNDINQLTEISGLIVDIVSAVDTLNGGTKKATEASSKLKKLKNNNGGWITRNKNLIKEASEDIALAGNQLTRTLLDNVIKELDGL